MNRKQLAEKFNVTEQTLRNWEKEKPELIKLINGGLLLDRLIGETEENLKTLKELKEKADIGKLII